MASSSDLAYLAACIDLAEQGRMTCAPNPTVGCYIVRDGKVLGRGYHARAGEGHAEVNALVDAACDIGGATVYVSLEPCSFESRTPACAQTLIERNPARVVVACLDPHPRVSGEGMNMLLRAGISAELIAMDAATECIEGYVSRVIKGRPLVRVKTASSLDGATALASGESQWITDTEARADVQYWRARSDAIVTGVDTVIADDPRLTVRDATFAHAAPPLRVVLDSRLRVPATAQLLNDGGKTLVVHADDCEPGSDLVGLANVEYLALPKGPRDLDAVLAHLATLGCNEVLVEAGPRVVGSVIAADLWDSWIAYVAPKWMGSEVRPIAEFSVSSLEAAPAGTIMDVKQLGQDIRVITKKRANNK